MADIPRGALNRTARLASLPLSAAGRATLGLGQRLAGRDRDQISSEMQRRTAEQLFEVLGTLKGGAMKFGQALSVYEAAIPDEYAAPYREALTKLQNAAPPMPPETVHKIMAHQFGTGWRSRFQEFDDTAAAAASIGQVHRGIWHDGRQVAVKLQYPGADAALRSEILKTPHHGSADFSYPFLQEVNAVVSLISSGDESEAKEYIHPRATLMAALGRASRTVPAVIFCTELAAFFKTRGYVPDPAAPGRSFFAFERTNFGIAHVRTDGKRVLAFTHSGKQGMNEAYRFTVSPSGEAVFDPKVVKRSAPKLP